MFLMPQQSLFLRKMVSRSQSRNSDTALFRQQSSMVMVEQMDSVIELRSKQGYLSNRRKYQVTVSVIMLCNYQRVFKLFVIYLTFTQFYATILIQPANYLLTTNYKTIPGAFDGRHHNFILIWIQHQQKYILMQNQKDQNQDQNSNIPSQQPAEQSQPGSEPQSQPVSQQPNVAQNNEGQDEWESFGEEESGNLVQLAQQIINGQPSQEQQEQWEQEQQEPSSNIQQPTQNQQYTLGCEHYLRNCSVEAPCCKIYYTCKLCHDEKYEGPKSKGCKVERMAFEQVGHVKCLKCGKIQEPSLKCTNPECEITFGKYACLKCKLYENRSTKVNDIFHCDECKMCRRGKVQTTFHCKNCGYCRPISEKGKHKCTENVAQSQCPICLEVLKYSVKHYMALPCGHLIHLQCLKGYRDINCPVCGMATQKYSQAQNKQMDMVIEQTKGNLPKQLADKKVDILCNECLFKSFQQPFHFFGIKCQGCGTYNTKMI